MYEQPYTKSMCYAYLYSIDKEIEDKKKTEIYFNEICKMRWKSIISNAMSIYMWKILY